jgi:hypothetical protein
MILNGGVFNEHQAVDCSPSGIPGMEGAEKGAKMVADETVKGAKKVGKTITGQK